MTTIAGSRAPEATLDRLRSYTPDEFLELEAENGVAYELDDHGHLVERNMGQESDEIAFRVGGLLHTRLGGLGRIAGGGTGLQIFPDRPRRIPRPDVYFISHARLPHSVPGHLQVPPELVVEVVSPGDHAGELEAKVEEYLAAGVLRVWVVYPDTKSVFVRRPDGSGSLLTGDDVVEGEDAAPVFKARVSEFFE